VYWVQCDVVFTDLLVHHGAGLVCYQDWLGEIKIFVVRKISCNFFVFNFLFLLIEKTHTNKIHVYWV